jgi:hypothetical protein
MTPSIPAVLVTAYNRVETTARVLDEIRRAGVSRLYFYVDGPGSAAHAEACARVRELGDQMEDGADVLRLFPESNLGPRNGVASAISWFFEHEEEGIVLEHDCLPSADFFNFSAEMLARYRDDTRIMHVAGTAPYSVAAPGFDYYFIRVPLIWGWASWRRAWRQYDPQLQTLAQFRDSGTIAGEVNGRRAQANWMHYFHAAAAGNLLTWDYPWTYAVMRNHGLCATPVSNMVSNIGFGEGSLHSRNTRSRFAKMPTEALHWPIRHPAIVAPSVAIERRLNRDVFRHKTLKYLLDCFGLGRVLAESKAARMLAGRWVKWTE